MPRVLGLDLSSKTGFAVLDTEVRGLPVLVKYGGVCALLLDATYPLEEYRYIGVAHQISQSLASIVRDQQIEFVIIEQSNRGKNRHTQKFIEFIHCLVLLMLKEEGLSDRIYYIDTSAWRKILNQRLSKEQRLHNKDVKAGKVRGRITPKHISVQWVNETYNLNFKLKDNDLADAICIAVAGVSVLERLKIKPPSDQTIEQALFD